MRLSLKGSATLRLVTFLLPFHKAKSSGSKKKEDPIFTWRPTFPIVRVGTLIQRHHQTLIYVDISLASSWHLPGLDFRDIIFRNVEVTQARRLRIHQALLTWGGMIWCLWGRNAKQLDAGFRFGGFHVGSQTTCILQVTMMQARCVCVCEAQKKSKPL